MPAGGSSSAPGVSNTTRLVFLAAAATSLAATFLYIMSQRRRKQQPQIEETKQSIKISSEENASQVAAETDSKEEARITEAAQVATEETETPQSNRDTAPTGQSINAAAEMAATAVEEQQGEKPASPVTGNMNTTPNGDVDKVASNFESKLYVNGHNSTFDQKQKFDPSKNNNNKTPFKPKFFDKTRPPPSTKFAPRTTPTPTTAANAAPKDALTPNESSASGYKSAESPSGTSSEGSADSGRATGPNCSPFDHRDRDDEPLPMYEFEVPNTLVGLIIGVQGKTITELCRRAEVRMLIRPHHTASRFETHQICSIEGKRANINKCLHMIRYRFPQNRFPDLNLQPVFPPLQTPATLRESEPTALTLPVGAPVEVYFCEVVDAAHFFVHLPTHPTYPALQNLNNCIVDIYSRLSGIPVLPKPCASGIVCIAPTANGWYRAITLQYEPEDDTVIVRLADYGGFFRLPRTELRQIRSDLTSLPFQAVECYLAHVQPIDGTMHWNKEANDLITKMCASRYGQAEVKGYHKDSNMPCVELYVVDEHKTVKRLDALLLEKGFAKPSDPTKMIPVSTQQTFSKPPATALTNHHNNSMPPSGKFYSKSPIRR